MNRTDLDLRKTRGILDRLAPSLFPLKSAAADANARLGLLDPELAAAIREAAGEVADGRHDAHFPVDVFQTGSGTSSNMNANEVLARLASQRLGREVHPNDHVNMSQSSNDTIPTTIHVGAMLLLHGDPTRDDYGYSIDRDLGGVITQETPIGTAVFASGMLRPADEPAKRTRRSKKEDASTTSTPKFTELPADELYDVFTSEKAAGKPFAVVAHTVKGKSLSFAENNNDFHHAQLTQNLYQLAVSEIAKTEVQT